MWFRFYEEKFFITAWETGYYKNDLKNGLWLEYYENGNIRSKAEYFNGRLSEQRYRFSIDGDTLLPILIKPKLLPNIITATNDETLEDDTLIMNNTDLKVYLLLDLEDSIVKLIGKRFRIEGIYSICQNDYLTITTGDINIKVTPTGTIIYEQFDTICNKKIADKFGTNVKVKVLKDGDYEVIPEYGKKRFKSRLGKIEVDRQSGCIDTGRNPIKITRNSKTLLFNDIGNLVFFEFDSDNDGKKELYILTYFTCMGRLEFYKVDDK